jgi:hypothetical protein
MRTLTLNPKSSVLLLGVLAAAMLASGCNFLYHNGTVRSPSRGRVAPEAGQALLVVLHVGSDAGGTADSIVFTPDGTPVCQVPHGTHCLITLPPGHHTLYLSGAPSTATARWELDVTAGATYFGTMSAVPWTGFVIEKLTPANTDRWPHLDEWLRNDEATIRPEELEQVRQALHNYQDLIRDADHRYEEGDAARREAWTFGPADGH